ncbi:NADH-quinone oxidoreductase subunit A [Acidithiobacillus sp. MC6.1]|nr:NADH-quinone oxidoreductase subunit A [Acidithiobacillus sp. MC6.1]
MTQFIVAVPPILWPLVVYFFVVIALVVTILAVSSILGERTIGRATNDIFESGIVTIGNARFRVPAKFYLIAMFFVIFDLETVYLFAWSVVVRTVGWPGYFEALAFIMMLVAALAYLWRTGALEWAPTGRRPLAVTAERRGETKQ